MTEQLFELIDKAEAEFDDLNEFTAAIIDLSKHKTVTTILLDGLNSATVHHAIFLHEIESSEEFQTVYGNDRLKLLKAYEAQKANHSNH